LFVVVVCVAFATPTQKAGEVSVWVAQF